MVKPEWLLPVVSSLVVQIKPEYRLNIESLIDARPDAEVYATDNHTKIVVVVEMASDRALADFMQELGAEIGVMTVNMVFHHTEEDEVLPRVSEQEDNYVR